MLGLMIMISHEFMHMIKEFSPVRQGRGYSKNKAATKQADAAVGANAADGPGLLDVGRAGTNSIAGPAHAAVYPVRRMR